jgi:hypothetical protein
MTSSSHLASSALIYLIGCSVIETHQQFKVW